MNVFKKAVLAASVAIAGFSTGAHAALIGNSITLTNGSYTETATVDNGIEFSGIADYLDFDFSATGLTVTLWAEMPKKADFPSDLGNFVFTGFADPVSTFALVTNAPKFNNFQETNFSFDATSITLNLSGIQPQNDQARLIFSFVPTSQDGGAGNNVPEPTTVALLGLGLLGVAAARRKAGKRANA